MLYIICSLTQPQVKPSRMFSTLSVFSLQYPLAGPSRTRLGNYLAQGFGDMYMQLCDIFSSVHTMVDTRQGKQSVVKLN